MKNRICTVPQLAQLCKKHNLGISERSIRAFIKNNTLPAQFSGSRAYISLDAFNQTFNVDIE